MKCRFTLIALLFISLCASGSEGTTSDSSAAPNTNLPAGGKPAGWTLTWADEFSVNGLPDKSKWDYDTSHNKHGWYNHELQYYSRDRLENAKVENGHLIITARKEKMRSARDYGGQAYTSSRMLTRGKTNWTYGFLEVRAKLPCGLGTWPAIWMLGSKGAWPEDGEIDIMEHVGKKRGEVLGSIHTTANNWAAGTPKTTATTVNDACDAFHNYQLTWTTDQILIGVDDVNYFQFNNPKDKDRRRWPFDDPQYLLLNIAIGGDLGGKVDDSIFPVKMEVDYVRMFQP